MKISLHVSCPQIQSTMMTSCKSILGGGRELFELWRETLRPHKRFSFSLSLSAEASGSKTVRVLAVDFDDKG